MQNPSPFVHTESSVPASASIEVLPVPHYAGWKAKEFVFAEGDPSTHLFRVAAGAIALYKIMIDGRRQIVGFAYPGDLVGLGTQGEYMMNAQSPLGCVVCRSRHCTNLPRWMQC